MGCDVRGHSEAEVRVPKGDVTRRDSLVALERVEGIQEWMVMVNAKIA